MRGVGRLLRQARQARQAVDLRRSCGRSNSSGSNGRRPPGRRHTPRRFPERRRQIRRSCPSPASNGVPRAVDNRRPSRALSNWPAHAVERPYPDHARSTCRSTRLRVDTGGRQVPRYVERPGLRRRHHPVELEVRIAVNDFSMRYQCFSVAHFSRRRGRFWLRADHTFAE